MLGRVFVPLKLSGAGTHAEEMPVAWEHGCTTAAYKGLSGHTGGNSSATGEQRPREGGRDLFKMYHSCPFKHGYACSLSRWNFGKKENHKKG